MPLTREPTMNPYIHSQWMYGSCNVLAKFHCYVSFPEQHWINSIESAHFLAQKTNMTMEKLTIWRCISHLKIVIFPLPFWFSGGNKKPFSNPPPQNPAWAGRGPAIAARATKAWSRKGDGKRQPKFIAVWNMDHESGDSWMYPDPSPMGNPYVRPYYRSYIYSGYSWVIIPKNPERTE